MYGDLMSISELQLIRDTTENVREAWLLNINSSPSYCLAKQLKIDKVTTTLELEDITECTTYALNLAFIIFATLLWAVMLAVFATHIR